MGSGGQQASAAQELEAGPAVHLALQELELVDLALSLAVTPREFQPSADGGPVAAEADRETAQLGQLAPLRLSDPGFESLVVPLAHDGEKAPGQFTRASGLWTPLAECLDEHPLVWLQVVWTSQQQPGGLTDRNLWPQRRR